VPKSIVKRLVSANNLDVWIGRGWQAVRQDPKTGMTLVMRKLTKWEKFECRVREFVKGIYLEDTIDPEDFGFTKYANYQLDACGGLAGHFILIDCTSANEPGARSLREKIKDFHNKQPDFQKDLGKRFVGKYKQFHYAICTQHIDVSDSDIEYARNRGIGIIPSENLEEWMKLASIGSPTLGFQFVEFFAKEKIQIPKTKPLRFPALRLPYSAADSGRILYAFSASPKVLLQLSYVYRLEYKDVKGYQRPLKIAKLRAINQFLAEDPHNGFPTSLLVAFDQGPGRELQFEPTGEELDDPSVGQLGTLVVPPFYGIAELIDGQHRLFGYYDFTHDHPYATRLQDRRNDDRLLVVAYPDPKGTERPKLFLDINSNQTRVSTRQIWAMMGDSRPETQMGYISNLVRRLNESGVLCNAVQIPGDTRGTRTINIANFGKGIQDRHLVDSSSSFDWNLYEGVRPVNRYPAKPANHVVESFEALFSAAKETASGDWTAGKSFLRSNNGVNVLLRVYVEILKYYRQNSRQARVDRAKIRRILAPTLADYIRAESSAALVRRTSTEAGREGAAAELMKRMKRRHPGFAANLLAARSRRGRAASPP
jgi:DGQHR domain-containing protein